MIENSTRPEGESVETWDDLASATRTYLRAAVAAIRAPNIVERMRASLNSGQYHVPLFLLAALGPEERLQLLPELIKAACGSDRTLELARNIIRCMPRGFLLDNIVHASSSVLEAGEEADYWRLYELFVELRAEQAISALRERAAAHSGSFGRELLDVTDGVEGDESRWGRLVKEWPIS